MNGINNLIILTNIYKEIINEDCPDVYEIIMLARKILELQGMKNIRYTVRRITKSNKLFGATHGSDDADTTCCGKTIDSDWYILTTRFDGIVECHKCKKEMEK